MLKLLNGNLTLISQLQVLTRAFIFESTKEKLSEISTQQFSSLHKLPKKAQVCGVLLG
jgi:hypothetical protein